ncbi:hypothetical protein C8R47DRAFT_1066660 [Mycena vitilis]|nr:hypothetical protein C8R47DRAFT_1066660 [Mycena vitilis]
MSSFTAKGTLIEELLSSSETKIRRYTCGLLGILAASYPSLPWCSETCVRMVHLLSDENPKVREDAFHAFLKVVEKTKIWDQFPEHLSPLSSIIRQITVDILANLAVHAVRSLAVESSRTFMRKSRSTLKHAEKLTQVFQTPLRISGHRRGSFRSPVVKDEWRD